MKEQSLNFWLSEKRNKILCRSAWTIVLVYPGIPLLESLGFGREGNGIMNFLGLAVMTAGGCFYGGCCGVIFIKLLVLLWNAQEVMEQRNYGPKEFWKEYALAALPLLPMILFFVVFCWLGEQSVFSVLRNVVRVWWMFLERYVLGKG